jgi:hypothetical protein
MNYQKPTNCGLVAGEMMKFEHEIDWPDYGLKRASSKVIGFISNKDDGMSECKTCELLLKKIESTFNSMDKLGRDESISDKQFAFHAGFLMSKLLDDAQEALRQVGELNKPKCSHRPNVTEAPKDGWIYTCAECGNEFEHKEQAINLTRALEVSIDQLVKGAERE